MESTPPGAGAIRDPRRPRRSTEHPLEVSCVTNLALPAGARLRLGDQALIEVTGLRNPCVQLDGLEPGLMAATLYRDDHGKPICKAGVMAIVVEGGEVRPGDRITVELSAGPHQPLRPV